MPRPNTSELVFRKIQERIKTGALKPGQRIPSERRLASEFGTSRASIQEAMDRLEKFGLIDRKPNHRPVVVDETASHRNRSTKVKDQIAVWIQPDLDDYGASTILKGIRAGFARSGHHLLIGCPPSTEREVEQRSEAEFLRSLVQDPSIAGAIVWESGGPEFLSAYRELADAHIPVVFIDREPAGHFDVDVVACNHRRGAMKVVRHLIDLGHRDIMMLVNDEHVSSVRDRIQGYRDALDEAGIAFRANYLLEWNEEQRTPGNPVREAAVNALLAMPQPPTAIFVINDLMALNLKEALEERGILVPQDISLVGFDWLMRWVPSGGELTTVAQPFDAIGRTAAECLLQRIRSGAQYVARHILLEAALVARATTGPPRSTPTLRLRETAGRSTT